MTNMDKLYEAVEARGPVCVGLDTDFSYLPADFVDTTLTKGENIVRFNKKLIDATKAVAGCYKVQIAYYESLGLEGMKAYAETLAAVRGLQLLRKACPCLSLSGSSILSYYELNLSVSADALPAPLVGEPLAKR